MMTRTLAATAIAALVGAPQLALAQETLSMDDLAGFESTCTIERSGSGFHELDKIVQVRSDKYLAFLVCDLGKFENYVVVLKDGPTTQQLSIPAYYDGQLYMEEWIRNVEIQGDLTFTSTAADSAYEYTLYEYRLQGQQIVLERQTHFDENNTATVEFEGGN